MIDRQSVERAAGLFEAPERSFERLVRRRNRRRRNRWIAAAVLAIIVTLATFAGLIRTFRNVQRPADEPKDIFARVHGWIVYGKSGGPQHLTSEGTWVVRGEGIWAVNPERPGHREDRVRLSDQVGDPIAWSADGSALLILRVWSPDGTALSKPGPIGKAGVSIGLVVLHADGTETRAVTLDPEWDLDDSSSSLSPDGSQVVYAVYRQPCGSGIYIVDAEGGTPRLLRRASECGGVYAPAFSPDATKIAYFDGGGDHDHSLKVMNADGTNVRVLFGHNQPQVNGSPALVGGLVWSPDGSHLAFDFVSVVGTSGIWVIRADGSGLRRVIADGSDPSWSPDGSRIAYRHAGAIYVANRDGTRARRVADLISLAWFKGSLTWNPLPLSSPSDVGPSPTIEGSDARSLPAGAESTTTEGASMAAPLTALAALAAASHASRWIM